MKDKVAVVTGASSGIGRAAALVFAQNGANVVAVGRNESELTGLCEESRGSGGSIRIHLAELTETSQVERLVSDTVEHFGRIDVLVNAAGIIKNGSIENTTLDDWDKMMNINLRSVFYLIQKCVPQLELNEREHRKRIERDRVPCVSRRSCVLRFESRDRSAYPLFLA